MSENEFDAVVIGSGMGGLAAARALAEFGGSRVLVLEQHYTLGGMTHEFSREGRWQFGTGLHYLGATSLPFLDFMTDGRVQLTPLPDDFDVLHFPGLDFAVPASAQRFRERLKERFPAEADAVDRFFASVPRATGGLGARNVFSSFPAPVRALGFPVIERLFPSTYRTLWDHVCRYFQDPQLRAVVAARWGLYGPPPVSGTFGQHAVVAFSAFADGGTHPVGGPREVSRIALEIAARHGIALRARQRVDRILVEHGRAAGVDVTDESDGRTYRVRARTVVSAVGVRNTYALLGSAVAPRWQEAVSRLPGEVSAIMLFLGMDRSPAEFGLRGENHWIMPDLGPEGGLDRPPGEGTLYVSFSSLNNPAARAHTVEVLELVDPAEFAPWHGRPDGYPQLKAALTGRLLDRLETRWPGFRDAVGLAELATPLSFETYQNSTRGGFYGLPATVERLRSPLAGCRTPVRGVVVAGQDAWGPGVVGAVAGGLMAANAVLPPARIGALWRAVRAGGRPPVPGAPWQGYLRVAQLDELSPAVRRIRLAPLDNGPMPFTFTAGQYLKVDIPVAVEPIERAYSISSGPGGDAVDIAVKREPRGLGSAFLHDALRVGQALRVRGPFGEFTVTGEPAAGTLLLIAGGVGITPLMSMLHAAADAGRTGPIVLLAGARTEDEILFRPEIDALRERLPGLVVEYFVSRPAGRRIGVEALRRYAADASLVHLCGPAAMMGDVIGILAGLGVPRDAIRTEAFVSGRGAQTRRERAHAVELRAKDAGITAFTIGVDGGGSFPCPPGRTILHAANDAHVTLPQSCDEGVCGTCRVRVLAGPSETDGRGMFSAEEAEAGWRLACQTLPTGDLTITT
ncbi:2Fe-2S iron-sulfur cluster-binding protein [Catenuloplanes japonicus]|uniref:2Fe-2S iron-sulfur cluster-binding protein n=1 Tax=Catenuloplanes japonicus TaxID=33876 RepID=UPI000525DB17|nr:2Fe-2S iron-sulfur cluster-binding protein [Catenuloplanes japonicus]